jgi:hypothetical protein
MVLSIGLGFTIHLLYLRLSTYSRKFYSWGTTVVWWYFSRIGLTGF